MSLLEKDKAALRALLQIQLIELTGNLLCIVCFFAGIAGPIWLAITYSSTAMLLLWLVVPLAIISAACWFNGLVIISLPAGIVSIGIPGGLMAGHWLAWVGVASFVAFAITQRQVPKLKKEFSRNFSD